VAKNPAGFGRPEIRRLVIVAMAVGVKRCRQTLD
jgi:hypothetical protein